MRSPAEREIMGSNPIPSSLHGEVMIIKLFNTMGRKKMVFKPLKKGRVSVYSCGPTVYWNQHIGHMYAYVQWDSLVRFLRYVGYKVKWMMNLTDVGHMTSDEDTGEDKMEKGAKREGLTVWQIADKYIAQFLDSINRLNIQRPDVLCRATEHIQEQIDLIKKIEANGFTYKTKTGLVFDTSKFKGYADFAHLNLDEQHAGARVEVDPEKKKPWDFLLWVTNQPNHVMQWDSPWGRGFPGWHIECTAMSVKYLGEQFDIHTGGKEHIPVHHTNEIAQAYGAFGRQTANFWLHNEWMTINGEKISKSSGNSILVSDLIEKEFNPLALRYLILTSHYRTGLNFTWESLKAAQSSLSTLREYAASLQKSYGRKTDKEKMKFYREKFLEALSDDLNMPKALSILWKLLREEKGVGNKDKYKILMEFDEILGLKIGETKLKEELPEDAKKLIKEREDARKRKDWKRADEIRKELLGMGIIIEDTPEGVKWKIK